MLRCGAFGGLFIMKRGEGDWEYLSSYSRRKDNYTFKWSDNQVRYFSDGTIEKEVAWKTFAAIREQYPNDKLVLYAKINGNIVRVKYYNPNANPKTVSWHSPSDFYAYIPRQMFY